ncbi:sce7726 family protein [Hymenobacter sp. GOD-10R]|uniref:sce7726 family protein n=1 Tax=Hymenobacter sp. GOD-10R TaxID=3093922 RepID=UPI002D78C509|nr:sce7726 family protein [Hymenobacter sp. GOD-10R]WRQ26264.1 sce7726 family protein [Hymenobacter sp. GOD-10R]
MNDPEIRALLYPLLQDGVYVDELPTGTTRADVVHITPTFMHCYEVKGDADTLKRVLPQLKCYGVVYDLVTFVVTERHVEKLLPMLPAWVGVMVASAEGVRTHRPALYNSAVERAHLAGLLLREEVQQYLMTLGLKGASQLRRRELVRILAQTHSIPLSGLAQFVRERLIARMPQRLQNRAERKAERQRIAARRRKRKKHKAAAAVKQR